MLHVDLFPNMIYYQVIFKPAPGSVLVEGNNISYPEGNKIRIHWWWEEGRLGIQGLHARSRSRRSSALCPGKPSSLREAPLVSSPGPGFLSSGEANLKVSVPNLGVRVEP